MSSSTRSDSSDSDNDNDSRRHRSTNHRPPPPGNKHKSKKKKKSTLPPQDAVNKVWSRFSASDFSKATVVLPFAVASAKATARPLKSDPPPQPLPNNLLVSEDFERAVQECKTKVSKLIKECKRVNMRYRDPSFDIDWDLKRAKGHCLNGLRKKDFEIDGRAFINPMSIVPKAVKRVHEIFDAPTFLKDKVLPSDIMQGTLDDCWLMASLTALANTQVGIQRLCVEYDTKVGIYGFVFHRDGEWIVSIIDDKLYLKSPDWDSPSVQRHLLEQIDREDTEREYRKTYQTGSQALVFGHCRDQNETWLPLLEKAYAKAHGDYASLAGGWIGEGVEDLTGGVTTELLTSDILDTDEFWNNEILKVNKEFLFGCSTGLVDGGYGNRDGISEGHAYVIMEARELSTGERLLKLRNPWGKGKRGNWEGAWSDGSKEFTPEAQIELNHKFGNDSVFWISYKDLLRKYEHFDRTRLFMDSPDWRVTHKWISADVPWKAEFERKFRIILKKESPVVLVVSQLDDRYFNGMQGQYSFRLQFRLHEEDSPGEEDYIVRSHGNYLMDRSVVAELKSLSAGTYSVFVMVVAERDTNKLSVQDVVKAECRDKVDNDKLVQVGTAYDLAHSRGSVHMESKVAARKALEKVKARESRIAMRKKNWARRHMGNEILKKQEKKNVEKRKLKEAKDAAEAKEKQEKEPKDKAVQTEDAKEVQIEKEDKAIQTEEPCATSPPTDPSPASNNKGVQTDMAGSSDSSQGTAETPKSSSTPNTPPLCGPPICLPLGPPGPYAREQYKVALPSFPQYMRGPPPPQPPPPPPPALSRQRRNYVASDGESSASPISDFENMYSDDDIRPKPNLSEEGKDKGREDDDEDADGEPDPWNAVCIVGLRVYSKDEELEVSYFEEFEDDLKEAKGDGPAEVAKGDQVAIGEDVDGEDGGDDEDQIPKSNEEVDKKFIEAMKEVEVLAWHQS